MTNYPVTRNPVIEIAGRRIKLIGDVHLGKSFQEFVPLSRRGEREKLVWEQFVEELKTPADLTIQMGDLFDRMEVSYRLLLEAFWELQSKNALIIAGNHDSSRDASKMSALDVLNELLCESNVTVINAPSIIEGLGFAPWSPFKTAKEVVEELELYADGRKLAAVFGHWDIDDFGKQLDNRIPLQELSRITDQVFTGHVHTPDRFVANGVTVNVVGSMQPYSFAEDPDVQFYETLTKEQLENRISANPNEFKNKCVRVLIKDDESLPEVECLQLKPKYANQKEETLDTKVEYESFKFQDLFDEAFELINPEIKKEVWDKYETLKTDDSE